MQGKQRKPKCAIVDAFSSGEYLALELSRRGYECIHVLSNSYYYTVAQSPCEKLGVFSAEVVHSGDLMKTLEALQAFRVDAVFAGSEQAVELTDYLTENLGLPTNGTHLSSARRDKAAMADVLRRNDIRTIPSICTDRVDAAVDWCASQSASQYVLKPVNSTGCDGVVICENASKVRSAFGHLIGRKNKLGFKNERILVQPFLEGEKYLINTVSIPQEHVVTDIEMYQVSPFQGADFVHDWTRTILERNETTTAIVKYTKTVLDTLGFKSGAALSEIIVTNDGPVLIEVGARLCGGGIPKLVKACQSYSQVDALIDSYFDPSLLKQSLADNPPKMHGTQVYLRSDTQGRLERELPIAELTALPSFHSANFYVKAGGLLQKTVDMISIPGSISLVHENPTVIQNDYNRIRLWETFAYQACVKSFAGPPS